MSKEVKGWLALSGIIWLSIALVMMLTVFPLMLDGLLYYLNHTDTNGDHEVILNIIPLWVFVNGLAFVYTGVWYLIKKLHTASALTAIGLCASMILAAGVGRDSIQNTIIGGLGMLLILIYSIAIYLKEKSVSTTSEDKGE